jgi:hypothetical protein
MFGEETRPIIGGASKNATYTFFLEIIMKENKYQADLIKRIKAQFPGIVILKNDPNYLQGVPDLSLFYENRWAMLEAKASGSAPVSANQKHYVDLFDRMSYADFIYPENERRVLDELQRSFSNSRATRLS